MSWISWSFLKPLTEPSSHPDPVVPVVDGEFPRSGPAQVVPLPKPPRNGYWHPFTSIDIWLFALFNFICFCSLLKFRNLEYKVGLTFWPCLSNFALTFQPEPFGSAPKRPEDLHSELAETTVSATLCLQSYCANVATENKVVAKCLQCWL